MRVRPLRVSAPAPLSNFDKARPELGIHFVAMDAEQMKAEAQAAKDELDLDEEHSVWLRNSVYLYDYQKTYGLEWPSLTVQWLPGIEEHPDDKDVCVQNLLLGTHAGDGESNYLLLAEVTLPLPTSEIDLRTEEDGEVKNHSKPGSIIHYKTRIRHDGEVNRARYMPQNSKMVATKSPSENVYVFNTSKHPEFPVDDAVRPHYKCTGHNSEGYGISWNPNIEGQLLSGAGDGTVCIWNLKEASSEVAPLHKFTDVHADGVEGIDWHKHNSYLFGSVGNDSNILLYDLRDGQAKTQKIPKAHAGDVHCIAFNGNNEHLFATGGADNVVNLWDIRKMGDKLHAFEGHTKEVLSVEWAPYDEAVLASGSADRRVNIWDVNKIGNEQSPEEAKDGPPELYFVHGGHKASVSDFSWNPEADYMGVVASVDERNALQVWQSVDLDEEDEGPADADLEATGEPTDADLEAAEEPKNGSENEANKKSERSEEEGDDVPSKKPRVSFA